MEPIQYKQWAVLDRPNLEQLPRPVFVRADQMPAMSWFPAHRHDWDQLVYAYSGVLMVEADNKRFVIPPEQAVWLPAGLEHSTYTMSGARFRSLYIDKSTSGQHGLSANCRVLEVSALLQELIIRAAEFPSDYNELGSEGRLITVLLEEISNMEEIGSPLPWPKSTRLIRICERIYLDPSDQRSMQQWGEELGTSSRTLARHLESETGLSFREWRRRLRLFKALEYLGEGSNVTATSLMLGYGSTSSFIHAFKQEYGATPLQFLKHSGIDRSKQHSS